MRDNTLLHKVIDLLYAMMNPFDPADKERLYNVATGKAASADTEKLKNCSSSVDIVTPFSARYL